jgi:hypothetical protein
MSQPEPAAVAETDVDDGIPDFLRRKPAEAPAAAHHLAPIETLPALPALVDRAATALAGARTAAEVLEARDMAGIAYDAAKKAARLHEAKGAHDALIAAAHRAQADALEIEAGAKRRLADEYDAAQERGEVVGPKGGGDSTVPVRTAATAADLGLTRKQIHEAREVRDAELADPGIVRRTLDEAIDDGEEPTRAKVKRAVKSAKGRAQSANKARAAKPEAKPAEPAATPTSPATVASAPKPEPTAEPSKPAAESNSKPERDDLVEEFCEEWALSSLKPLFERATPGQRQAILAFIGQSAP